MVKQFIENEWLWARVSKDPELLNKAMRDAIEAKVLQHPHLKHDVFLCNNPGDIIVIVICDQHKLACHVTNENFDRVLDVLNNTPNPAVRTALTTHIPTVQHFLYSGGKGSLRPHSPLSGETGYVYTIAGKFRGKVDDTDPNRLVWSHYKE